MFACHAWLPGFCFPDGNNFGGRRQPKRQEIADIGQFGEGGDNRPMQPDYWSKARAELAATDPILAGILAAYSGSVLTSRGDPFATLARSVIGQQISVKAADAVWGRFVSCVGQVTPRSVSSVQAAELAACGLSRRKVEYLADLAGHFASGRVDPGRWADLGDEAVIAQLTDVRGIGRWTAEMFLIFNLLRPDVLPVDDLGLQKAVALHYCQGERPQRDDLLRLAERWRPWRSVATWYLWRSLDPLPVEY
jgi:DNA-3-methyladenine glycosylase II